MNGKQRKKKLSRKLLLGISLFSLALFVFLTIFLGFNYYYSEMKDLSDSAYAYARSASYFIDGDKVLGYLENQTPEAQEPEYATDAYYDEVHEYLKSIKQEHELMKYFYVFVPGETTVTYVWDADEGEDASMLGDTEEYMDGGKDAVNQIINDPKSQNIQTYQDETWGYIACAFYPIWNSKNEAVAIVGVDLTMEGIRATFLGYLFTIASVMVVVFLVGAILLYLLINKGIVKPIKVMNTATKKLVENLEGDAQTELNIHTHDEIEDLAQSFGKMNTDLRDYIVRLSTVTAEKERIGAELNVATQIQADMLPRIFPPFPERTDFDIFASMTPAKEVGGDFYDFFLIDQNHIALVMADVSGKGVPAALFMVIAKTLIKNRALMGDSPAQILTNVNEQLCEGNEAELFVTVWLAIIDTKTGKGLAANAGHEHPAIRRKDGSYELSIYRHSPAVATLDGIRFKEHAFELNPGDSLFVYTDGVTESTDNAHQLFGNDRLLAALNDDPDLSPEKLLPHVRERIDEFVGSAPQFDDITMLGFRYLGEEKANVEELTLDATVDNLQEVLSFVDTRLEALGCGPKEQMQLDLVVEELFVNVAHYAYGEETGKASLAFEPLGGRRVRFTLTDSGKAYDPLSRTDPDVTLSAEERQIGGLGIFLVKKNVDEISYERKDDKNVLTFVKSF